MRFWTTLASSLLAVGITSAAMASPARITPAPRSLLAHPLVRTQANCPPYSGGTGILADGDFSQAPDAGTVFLEFGRGAVFAPDWVATGVTIDLYGSSGWGPATGYCSVDLDGTPGHGGIRHSAFATVKGATYTVTFLFSGNGACGPTVKTMLVDAAHQISTLTWNISSGNDAQHGAWLPETWTFKARGATSSLKFKSLDPNGGNCGPVVAAISVTQN